MSSIKSFLLSFALLPSVQNKEETLTTGASVPVILRIKTQGEFWGAEHRTQDLGQARQALEACVAKDLKQGEDRTCTCKQDLRYFAKSLTIRFRTVTKHLPSM